MRDMTFLVCYELRFIVSLLYYEFAPSCYIQISFIDKFSTYYVPSKASLVNSSYFSEFLWHRTQCIILTLTYLNWGPIYDVVRSQCPFIRLFSLKTVPTISIWYHFRFPNSTAAHYFISSSNIKL